MGLVKVDAKVRDVIDEHVVRPSSRTWVMSMMDKGITKDNVDPKTYLWLNQYFYLDIELVHYCAKRAPHEALVYCHRELYKDDLKSYIDKDLLFAFQTYPTLLNRSQLRRCIKKYPQIVCRDSKKCAMDQELYAMLAKRAPIDAVKYCYGRFNAKTRHWLWLYLTEYVVLNIRSRNMDNLSTLPKRYHKTNFINRMIGNCLYCLNKLYMTNIFGI